VSSGFGRKTTLRGPHSRHVRHHRTAPTRYNRIGRRAVVLNRLIPSFLPSDGRRSFVFPHFIRGCLMAVFTRLSMLPSLRSSAGRVGPSVRPRPGPGSPPSPSSWRPGLRPERRVVDALKKSADRAWRALEVALAGESLRALADGARTGRSASRCGCSCSPPRVTAGRPPTARSRRSAWRSYGRRGRGAARRARRRPDQPRPSAWRPDPV